MLRVVHGVLSLRRCLGCLWKVLRPTGQKRALLTTGVRARFVAAVLSTAGSLLIAAHANDVLEAPFVPLLVNLLTPLVPPAGGAIHAGACFTPRVPRAAASEVLQHGEKSLAVRDAAGRRAMASTQHC